MNNRDYKTFAQNEIYHVYNRGVGKMEIFKDTEDFESFLYRLKENLFPELSKNKIFKKSGYRRKILPSSSFDLITYCLMPNHFHLLIKQNSDLPISLLMLKLCGSYSKYFNKKYDRVGSLFQDQFKAVLIEKNEQLLWTSFYIHDNPRKANITKDLSNYKWSSFIDYSDLKNDTLCKKELILEQFHSSKSNLEYYKNPAKSELIYENLIGHQDILLD